MSLLSLEVIPEEDTHINQAILIVPVPMYEDEVVQIYRAVIQTAFTLQIL